MKIENVILANLLKNYDYAAKASCHIDISFFPEKKEKILYGLFKNYFTKHSCLPTDAAFLVDLSKLKISQSQVSEVEELHKELMGYDGKENLDWLFQTSEQWCKDRALRNSIYESIAIMEGEKKGSKEAIPEMLEKALAISFNDSIGHDYLEDSNSRYDFYTSNVERIPFPLDCLNKMTKGGAPRKTMTVCVAATGVGKSIFLCNHAANAMTLGYNVLYLTMELDEKRIAERIDANLLNVSVDTLPNIPQNHYQAKFENVRQMCKGRLMIKEYSPGQANYLTFKALVNELRTKKNFYPDTIVIDYVNICSAARFESNSTAKANTYLNIKAIAEELRGLGRELNVQIVTATQFSKEGYDNTEAGLTNIAESKALADTADFVFGLISTPAMEELSQLVLKQMKNRFGDVKFMDRWTIGTDRPKMRFFDIGQSANTNTVTAKIAAQSPKPQTETKQQDDYPYGIFANKKDSNTSDWS